MKSYTDINQSKILVTILPLESADYYHAPDAGVVITTPYITYCGEERCVPAYKGAVPCWSLTALLSVFPPYLFEFERGIDFNVYPKLNGKGWLCSYLPNCIENMKKDKFKLITSGDNPIDACYKMIIKLHELNLLQL